MDFISFQPLGTLALYLVAIWRPRGLSIFDWRELMSPITLPLCFSRLKRVIILVYYDKISIPQCRRCLLATISPWLRSDLRSNSKQAILESTIDQIHIQHSCMHVLPDLFNSLALTIFSANILNVIFALCMVRFSRWWTRKYFYSRLFVFNFWHETVGAVWVKRCTGSF